MKFDKTRIYIFLGAACNLALVILFVSLYFSSQPSETDLRSFPVAKVPAVESPEMESMINRLKKVDSLPINIDPKEIGKLNPYN